MAAKFLCSRCGISTYCNAACQKAHWTNGHKKGCINIQEFTIELDRQKVLLGLDHPEVLSLMEKLADGYCQQGKHDLAESLLVQCVEKRRVIDAEHPEVLLAIMEKLADVLQTQQA